MALRLRVNEPFPDFVLPDQQGEIKKLSDFTKAGLFDRYSGMDRRTASAGPEWAPRGTGYCALVRR